MRSYLLRNRLSEDLDVAQVISFLAVAEEHTSAPVDDMRNHEVRMEVASFSLSLLYSKAIYVLMLALITWGGGGRFRHSSTSGESEKLVTSRSRAK